MRLTLQSAMRLTLESSILFYCFTLSLLHIVKKFHNIVYTTWLKKWKMLTHFLDQMSTETIKKKLSYLLAWKLWDDFWHSSFAACHFHDTVQDFLVYTSYSSDYFPFWSKNYICSVFVFLNLTEISTTVSGPDIAFSNRQTQSDILLLW